MGLASRFCETSSKHRELLTQHVLKDNQVLFPMTDVRFPEIQQEKLFEESEKLEEEKIGAG